MLCQKEPLPLAEPSKERKNLTKALAWMCFDSMITAKHGAVVGGRCTRLVAKNTVAAARISRRPGRTLQPVVAATIPSAQLAFAVIYGMAISMVFRPLCCGDRGERNKAPQHSEENESRQNEPGENSPRRVLACSGESRPHRLRFAGSDSVVTSEYTDWCEVSTDEECESLCDYSFCEQTPGRQSCSSDVSFVNPMFFDDCEGCFDPQDTSDDEYGNGNNDLGDSDDYESFEPCPSLSLLGRYSLRR